MSGEKKTLQFAKLSPRAEKKRNDLLQTKFGTSPIIKPMPAHLQAVRDRMKDKTPSPPKKMAKGGKVKKTGLAYLHKGEVVIPAHRVTTVDKALKKAGLKPLKK